MSIYGRFRNMMAAAFGPSESLSNGGGWLWRGVAPRTRSTVAVSEYSALNLPVVYASVNRISNPLGMFPIDIYRADPNTGDPVQDKTHRLNGVLNLRPNPYMSANRLKKTSQGNALLWGNGYLEIEQNNRGEAVGLWPLLSDRTFPDWVGPNQSVLKYRTNINGKSFTLDADSVVHIMDMSIDGYCGLSQIAIAREAIGLGLAMEEFGAKFFANDAKSGGFIMHPGKLGDKAVKNITESMQTQGGLDNAHRIKVLEEGAKFINTTVPPDDAQFLGSRAFQVEEIARIYNVPLFLLQSQEKGTTWGSGLEQMLLGFVIHTLLPWCTAWESEMNWKLFTAQERANGYHIKFNVDALLRGDMAARAAFYKTLYEIKAIQPNEVRGKENMPPYKGGDEFGSTQPQNAAAA